MEPLHNLPGGAAVGVLMTYLSDNPAVLTLAADNRFKSYFKKYQFPALTNFGTAFGMGLIITAYMAGLHPLSGGSFIKEVLIGNMGAAIGSVVSVRLMLIFTKRMYGTEEFCVTDGVNDVFHSNKFRKVRSGSTGTRLIESMLDGGKSGVNMGIAIISGVVIICTLVMMLTNGPSAIGAYTGAAFEGIPFLSWVADKLQFILTTLFGFYSSETMVVPVTALGDAGAAIGLVPSLVETGKATGNDIAVFTAMCMC